MQNETPITSNVPLASLQTWLQLADLNTKLEFPDKKKKKHPRARKAWKKKFTCL